MSQPQLVLRLKPMSVNQAYSTSRQGRRFLVASGKSYKLAVALEAGRFFESIRGYSGRLKLEYEIHGPWLTKEGKVSKTAGDLANFEKLLIDSVCESIDVNDASIFKIEAEKIVSDEWIIKVRLYPID